MNKKFYTLLLALIGSIAALLFLVLFLVLNLYNSDSKEGISRTPLQEVNTEERGRQNAAELGIVNDEDGEQLFSMNCKSCHKISSALVAPALGGVTERHSMDWIKQWVRGPRKMVESGDAEAIAIYNQWQGSGYMTAFYLSDEEIESIMRYVEYRTVVEGVQ